MSIYKVYNFHSDSGHGWLAVKMKELVELKIEHLISRYSYVKGKTVYLEEDCDLNIFMNEVKNKHGYTPIITDLKSVNRSVIRSYNQYQGVI